MNIFPTLISFILISTVCSNVYDDEAEATTALSKAFYWRDTSNRNYMRCTRRFTPGFCVSAVKSVWTFVFQIQNCTERLGCPVIAKRMNRYNSYIECMRRCQVLMDLYTNILTHDSRNITQYLRDRSWRNARRDTNKKYGVEDDEDYETEDESKGSEVVGPGPREEAPSVSDDVTVPDIDYVREDIERDDDEEEQQ